MQSLKTFLNFILLLIPSLGLGKVATTMNGSETISDPKILIAAGCYVILEFILGKTSLVKANSLIDLILRSIVGPLIYKIFNLKKYGYQIEGAK